MRFVSGFFGLWMVLTLWGGSVWAAEYTVDPAHSHVGFTIRHLVGRVPGEFRKYSATFQFDPKAIGKSSGVFTIEAASIDTNNEIRDKHLRAADFFDVEKYPTLNFLSRKVIQTGRTTFKLLGDLTIRGVTKPVSFQVKYLGQTTGMMKGAKVIGFTANSKIDRKEYGIVWNKQLDNGGLLLGDDVEIVFQIEAVEKPKVE